MACKLRRNLSPVTQYHTSQKKGKISYHMTAAIEPVNPMLQLSHSIEITMRETRQIAAASKQSTTTVTSW